MQSEGVSVKAELTACAAENVVSVRLRKLRSPRGAAKNEKQVPLSRGSGKLSESDAIVLRPVVAPGQRGRGDNRRAQAVTAGKCGRDFAGGLVRESLLCPSVQEAPR